MATTDITQVKQVHLFSNGDKYKPAKKFVINTKQTRTFDAFLNNVTVGLKPQFGAVRSIRTPEHGTAVESLDELEPGSSYVATGKERFKKMG